MSKYGFKVPVSGQKIPHGWFAALVRFMNSLILSGDGRYTMVERNESGTSVTLTPAVINALNKASGAPSAPGGANQDLTVSITGHTATIGISGSTSHVDIIGDGDVHISGNTNGQIVVSGSGYPVWGNMYRQQITPTSWTSGQMTPYILQHSGYLRIHMQPSKTYLGTDGDQERGLYCYLSVDGKLLYSYQRSYLIQKLQGSQAEIYLDILTQDSALIPVCSGSTITAEYYDSYNRDPAVNLDLFYPL